MKMIVYATASQQREITVDDWQGGEDIVFADSFSGDLSGYDVFFFLNGPVPPSAGDSLSDKTVFVNEVINTKDKSRFGHNIIRINGWPGFLSRDIWEAAGTLTDAARAAAQRFGRTLIGVEDVPGLVSARVIACVINEAYKALEENLAAPEAIDMALKLGTNYPFGPFEWCRKIGRERVHGLLTEMAKTDSRYMPLFSINNDQ